MLNKSCSAVVHVSLSLLFIHACRNYRSCITVRMNDSERQRRSLTSATRTMHRVAHKDAREAHNNKRKGHNKSPRMQHDALKKERRLILVNTGHMMSEVRRAKAKTKLTADDKRMIARRKVGNGSF